MAYEDQVPLTGQSLGQTRDTIKDNFVAIETVFNIDHVDFNASGEGKHAQVTLPQGSAPTVAANDVTLYSKDTNSRPTIFMRQESDGTEIQLSGPDPTVSTSGTTFLPGGLLLQWGTSASVNWDGNTDITFPTAFGANPYSITVTPIGTGGTSANTDAITSATVFTPRTNTGSGVVLHWMAMGPIA